MCHKQVQCYSSYFYVADLTHLAREKAKADAEYYKAERQAEAYKVCLCLSICLCLSVCLLVFNVLWFHADFLD